MSKIIDAVSLVLVYQDEVFVIKRQNNLRAFPGYWAFPGGKVDADDGAYEFTHQVFQKYPSQLMSALVREAQEELVIDLVSLATQGKVESLHHLGLAITPDFNPYRYATYFYKLTLKEKPQMKVDNNEAAFAGWMSGQEVIENYNEGKILAVPPVLKAYQRLGENPGLTEIMDLDFIFDKENHVPMIESVVGIRQLMPLSNTLPPANRTNCFIIGDEGSEQLIVDPSPKDKNEYKKLVNVIEKFEPTEIFITHHHKDHNEFADVLARDLKLPMIMSAFTYDTLLKKRGKDFFDKIETEIVHEGDKVCKWLGKDIFIFEVPGHDRGQLAIAPKSMEWFFFFFLFQGVGTVVVGGEEGDMAEYFTTLKKVISLKPAVVFPSHGIGLGGTHILEKTLEHRQHREDQVLEFYNNGVSPEQMLEKIYFDIPQGLKPYAMANITSHLQKLKNERKIS